MEPADAVSQCGTTLTNPRWRPGHGVPDELRMYLFAPLAPLAFAWQVQSEEEQRQLGTLQLWKDQWKLLRSKLVLQT